VNAEQSWRRLCSHYIRDNRAPIAALRHKFLVSKALHQHDPGTCDAGGVVAGLPEKAYPGIDGITGSKASDALAPCAVGLVRGSTIFNCSTTASPATRA
jgi:hypothetical protein